MFGGDNRKVNIVYWQDLVPGHINMLSLDVTYESIYEYILL